MVKENEEAIQRKKQRKGKEREKEKEKSMWSGGIRLGI